MVSKSRLIFIFALAFLKWDAAYCGNDLSVQIARDHVDVTVGFVGDSVEVFGDRRDPDTIVAIVVEGPEKDITLWKRARVLGAWINRHYVQFKDVPSYYHYAVSTDNLDNIPSEILNDYALGHDALFNNIEIEKSRKVEDKKKFEEMLLDKKRSNDIFFEEPASFMFLNDNFFRVSFPIPPSAPTGEYKVRSFLVKDNKVIQEDDATFKVEQVGLNAFIFEMSRDNSFVYALICIILAVFSGWLVSVLRVRP